MVKELLTIIGEFIAVELEVFYEVNYSEDSDNALFILMNNKKKFKLEISAIEH